MKLTDKQKKRLQQIADYVPTVSFPRAGFFNRSPIDRALLSRGLIARDDHTTSLGKEISFTIYGCVLTNAGREALAVAANNGGE